jgi:thermitase
MIPETGRQRCRGPRVGLCLLIAVIVAFGSRGAGQQPAAPQTGAPRQFWPQRPGVFAPLDVTVPPAAGAAQVAAPNEREFVANEVLVQFAPDVPEATRAAARAAASAVLATMLRSNGRLERLTTSLAVPDAIALLQTLPQVEFAEPNWIVRHYAESNDPYYTSNQLWGMYGDSTTPSNQYGSQAGEAWARGFTGSSTVYVAVIDEGIDFNHPDLAANIWTNPFDPVDGVDNDANGFVDDVHGWDFLHEDNSIYDGSPGNPSMDDHGTHVTGTIGARGGNGEGVAGVNWNVQIIGAKFLEGTGSTFDAVEALEYVTALKQRHGLNIVATNNSWGGPNPSTALHQAILRAAKEGILFVAAAGNGGTDGVGDNNDVTPHYPSNYSTTVASGFEAAADYEAVIAVASITDTGALSSFSNFGATSVDIGAPGSGIYSTIPQNGYSSFNGTSMATPHVTGAAALYKSMNPRATAAEIRDAILTHGVPTASLSGATVTGRRLNVGDFPSSQALPSLSINDISVTEGNSGTTNATFTASLSAASSSAVIASYATRDVTAVASRATRSNMTAISILDSASAAPFPSTIDVEAGLGLLTKIAVTLSGFTHTFPNDVDVLLVGPTGHAVMLMSDVGTGVDVTNLTLTFDDAAGTLGAGMLRTGVYRPTNLDTNSDVFSSPAPAPPYGSSLTVFKDTNPAGTWSLFIRDDAAGDAGTISGGWSITLETNLGDYVGKFETLTIPPGATQQPISITVNGDTTAEAIETFRVTLSNVSGATVADGEGVATILDDDDPNAVSGLIRAAHIIDLRTAVNQARVAHALAPFAFTDPTLTPQSSVVRAIHVTELRQALNEAYIAAGLMAPTYTDPMITPGVTVVRSVHITEIRQYVNALP